MSPLPPAPGHGSPDPAAPGPSPVTDASAAAAGDAPAGQLPGNDDAARPAPGDEDATPAPGSDAPAGSIGADAQAVLDAAKAAAQSYFGGFTALRRLFAAEVSLARDALIHALAYLLVATVMLGTAYLLLTALLVSGLRAIGAPWPLALGVPLVLSVGVAWFGIQRAGAALKHADFEATRRQLKRGFKASPDKETPL